MKDEDTPIAYAYSQANPARTLRPAPDSPVMSWLAAQSRPALFTTTVTRGARLATRNTEEFVDCEIALIDPWTFDKR